MLGEGGPERVDGVSPDAVTAAMRIRDRLGFSGSGTRGMYLCHSFCELGGTPLAEALDAIHAFLVTHPDEVLVVVNQDYVRPADFVGAVDAAGLGELAYRGPTTGRWPTLREMIDSGQRVLFMAENHAGARALVPPGLRPHHGGDAVPLLPHDAAHRPLRAGRVVRPEPRAGRRAALPRQPLGHHRPAAEAVGRVDRQRPRTAARTVA